jgi:succinate dehydrogenase / fumarate reductase membrane anchor subunit
VRDPAVSTAALLACAAILLHAWVGLRDVILDYVHPPAARFTALALLGVGIAAMAALMARVVLG